MIPDHLIDKAARAMHADDLLEGEHEKFEDSPPWYQAIAERRARAALEAVAHIIWNQGWEAGMSYVISLERGIDDDENVSNPYERNENA